MRHRVASPYLRLVRIGLWAHGIRQMEVDDVWCLAGLAIRQFELLEDGVDVRLQVDADISSDSVACDAHAQEPIGCAQVGDGVSCCNGGDYFLDACIAVVRHE